MARSTKFFAVLLMLVALPGAAAAQTLTFGGLGGSNGDAFTGPYAESGYTVSLIAGDICVAQAFGNPTPDLFGGQICQSSAIRTATLQVTRGGGFFQFLGTDLATANGNTTFSFVGLVGGGAQYAQGGTIAPPQVFQTIASANSATSVDELRITLTNTQGTSFNIDNIQLAASVPEPSSMILLATGLAGMAFVRRRREDVLD